jgi:DMSO/TMAO reductase YedYZ molybdopterin-dependent catalytic subunit
MEKTSLRIGAFIGAVLAFPVLGLFYLGEIVASLPFLPFDLFDWLARNLPGSLITLTIDTLVQFIDITNIGPTSETAKIIEQLMALMLILLVGAILGAVISFASGRGISPILAGGLIGILLLIVTVFVENNVPTGSTSLAALSWLGMLLIGWGLLTGFLVQRVSQAESAPGEPSRRKVLTGIAGGAFVVGFGAWGLGTLFKSSNGAEESLEKIADITTPVATGTLEIQETITGMTPAGALATTPDGSANRDSVPPAPGTRPELTPTEDFYRIDINTRRPSIEEADWQLEVAGLFDTPRTLTLEDIKSYPAVTQPITLSCISNRVGGDLIGTSNWTGIRLGEFLADLGIAPEAKELMIDAADGFFESVMTEDMMDPRTLLVYGMNGETLAREHGFPLRIYIPNRYGMKQPKWIVRITAVEEPVMGYWVVRGWSHEAKPQIVSVIDNVAKDEPDPEGRIPIGGIAWAGDRGIKKVEIQVDDGNWVEAVLRTPPLSPLTWVQWRLDWQPDPGKHTFTVRATDGEGSLQIVEESGVRPDGATGYHSVDVRI